MVGLSNISNLAVEGAEFDSLILCTSSTLQLVHWVPEQRFEMENIALPVLYLEDHADKLPRKNTPGAADCLQRDL